MRGFAWRRFAAGLVIGLVAGCIIGLVSGALRNAGYRSAGTVVTIVTPTLIAGLVVALWGARSKS